MDFISELINYCKTSDPVGALLLTGEWGSGKTYLIETPLRNVLEKECIIIRVSLFGIATIEELHKAVKKLWIHEKGGLIDKVNSLSKVKDFVETISKSIPNKKLKFVTECALSFNLFELTNVENTIGNKKVILVFDDIERSSLDISDILGVVNEYRENQKFNVIILCDERKLMEEKEYEEFKEKIIQRTLHYKPCYKEVVHSVINLVGNVSYKKCLLENEQYIRALFGGTDVDGNSLDNYPEDGHGFDSLFEIEGEDKQQRRQQLREKRPNNIRSLKAAIQDFERVYTILETLGVEDCSKWLLSYIAYTLASKANLIHKDDKYGYIPCNRDLDYIYPGFYESQYLPDSLKQWIDDGVWNEDKINAYIKHFYFNPLERSPKEQVREGRIDLLEEDVAIKGMKEILEDVYNGKLSLNEYVYFIINSRLVRYYNLFNLEIDWNKTLLGIKKSIENSAQNGKEFEFTQNVIEDLEGFSNEERTAYQVIKEARDESISMYEANRREYISEMQDHPEDAFLHTSNHRYNCFDREMAEATVEAYKNVSNMYKNRFPKRFEGMWENYRKSYDINQSGVEKSTKAFIYLRQLLSNLEKEYEDKPFKKHYTQEFISVIDTIIK